MPDESPEADLGFPRWAYILIGTAVLAIAGAAVFVPRRRSPTEAARGVGAAVVEPMDALPPASAPASQPVVTAPPLPPASAPPEMELGPVPAPASRRGLGLSDLDVSRGFGKYLELEAKKTVDGEPFRIGKINLPAGVTCVLMLTGDPSDLTDVAFTFPLVPEEEDRASDVAMLTVGQFMSNVVPGFSAEDLWWHEAFAKVADAKGEPQIVKTWSDRRLVMSAVPASNGGVVIISLQATNKDGRRRAAHPD